MGHPKILLTALRLLAVNIALVIIGFGAWAKIIIHDIDIRGTAVLDTVLLQQDSKEAWRAFFDVAVESPIRVWIAIAAGCFISLSMLLIVLSSKIDRMRISPYLLLPLEFLSMFAMAAAFGATLSFTLKLEALRTSGLDPAASADLRAFSMLLPLTKGYAIAEGTGLFLLITTSLSAVTQTCHRARDSKPCSFEPTAAALGMGHGYQAVRPHGFRSAIPTLYDPRKPTPEPSEPWDLGDEEKGFAIARAEMGRRGLDATADDREISGPLGLKKLENVAQIRPARPWSEMPKRK